MFTDIECKIKFYKERIIQEFIKRGIFPQKDIVQAKLDEIEMRMAIFKKPIIKEADVFDIEEYNTAINNIYNDLVILYDLLEKITYKQVIEMQDYINAHLTELNAIANTYLNRAKIESNTTSLGKTILFKDSDFTVNQTDFNTVIELGKVKLKEASTIACLTEIDNISYSDLVFIATRNDETIKTNAYNYNHDLLKVSGAKEVKTYKANISEAQQVNSTLELPILISNIEGEFITLAGENKITCKTLDDDYQVDKIELMDKESIAVKEHSYMDFYVIGAKSISFRFNKDPLSSNFNLSGNKIANLDYVQHFFIEADKGFAMDFEIEEGQIFAINESTIIDKNKLLYSGSYNVHDFLVINTLDGKENEYKISVVIRNTSIDESMIKNIILKEI